MDDYGDKDRDKMLEIIPSNQLRLIPLYGIITHIYENIIEKASLCEFKYDFSVDKLIENYELDTKVATSGNKTFIINEIKRLFPGIKITEIKKRTSCSLYNSYLSASWEEEVNDVDSEPNKTDNGVNDDDDIMLNQAIQLSLKEVKQPEIASSSTTSIMGQKAEERIQKSRQKYKKLYN
jgi:hypothetical protein